MDEMIKKTLDDILFQLHVLTSQNFMMMANMYMDGESDLDKATVKCGMDGYGKELVWMADFLEKRGEKPCAETSGSPS